MVKENLSEIIDLKSEKEKKEERKNRIIALAGSITSYTIILLLLLYFGFKAPDPPLDEVSHIAVVLGTTETGMNPTFEQVTPTPPVPTPPVKPQEQEEIMTEDASDVTIPAVKKKEEPKPKEKPVEKEPEKKPEPKEPERKVDENLLFQKNPNQSKGTGSESGDQGQKDGKADARSWQGNSQEGSGFGIEGMEGRGLKTPPRINDDIQREGKIVVAIVVDREGNVIEARGGVRGTTINDYNLITKAEEAARRTKFTGDANAQEKQYGKITFNFKLN